MISFNDNSFISNTYSATGEKLSTAYGIRMAPVLSPLSSGETAEANDRDGGISGGGSGTPEPQAGQIRHYCGNVVYDMGVTRLLTGEGYVTFASDGTPQYHYYLRDHLGNVRVVMDQTGAVEQVNHYYAFGGLMRESSNPGVQPYKYGGKELDRSSGLDAYDFGARSYYADRMQWSTMDPLCEKFYDVTPYGYCHDDPVRRVDPNGMDDWYNMKGEFLRKDGRESDNIVIQKWQISVDYENTTLMVMRGNYIKDTNLSAEAYSKVFTDILSKMDDVNIEDLHNSSVSTSIYKNNLNWYEYLDSYNDAFLDGGLYAEIGEYENKQNLTAYINVDGSDYREMFSTVSNVQNLLGVHEYQGHFKYKLVHSKGSPDKILQLQKKHESWNTTTPFFKKHYETTYK